MSSITTINYWIIYSNVPSTNPSLDNIQQCTYHILSQLKHGENKTRRSKHNRLENRNIYTHPRHCMLLEEKVQHLAEVPELPVTEPGEISGEV